MPFFWLLVVAAGVVIALAAAAAFYRFKNYRKAGPNQVLVISGRPSTITDAEGRARTVGYRLQIGGALGQSVEGEWLRDPKPRGAPDCRRTRQRQADK